MILKITKTDRERNPLRTRGRVYKLVSKTNPRKVLGYFATAAEAKKREGQIHYFKDNG